jgi:hypothetical protein
MLCQGWIRALFSLKPSHIPDAVVNKKQLRWTRWKNGSRGPSLNGALNSSRITISCWSVRTMLGKIFPFTSSLPCDGRLWSWDSRSSLDTEQGRLHGTLWDMCRKMDEFPGRPSPWFCIYHSKSLHLSDRSSPPELFHSSQTFTVIPFTHLILVLLSDSYWAWIVFGSVLGGFMCRLPLYRWLRLCTRWDKQKGNVHLRFVDLMRMGSVQRDCRW